MTIKDVTINVGGTFQINAAEALTLKDMAGAIWRECGFKPSIKMYEEALKHRRRVMVKEMYDTVHRSLIATPGQSDAALRRALRTVVRPDTPERTFEYYVQSVRQVMWQVKRKFLGKPTEWDIFTVFYSKEGGTGKSSWIHGWGRVLGPYFMEDADFDLFIDKFRKRSLNKYYLAFIDEMQGADNKELRAVKNTVTKARINGRGMHSEDEMDMERNVSFVGASNKRLTDDIRDESMRRWVEIECSERRIAADAERSKEMRALNHADSWACVSVDEPSPYSVHRELFEEHQKKLITESQFDAVSDELFTTEDCGDSDQLTNKEAWAAWCSLVSRPGTIQEFARKMKTKYTVSREKNPLVFKNIKLIQGVTSK